METISPWIDYQRPAHPALKTELVCDTAIVGGGISGVSTLYYLLTEILSVLKTIAPTYIAAAIRTPPLKAFRMNSAKFCYFVLQYLQTRYPDRFSIYEETEIQKIDLSYQFLHHPHGKIHYHDLILCTNGYNHIPIYENNHPFTKLKTSIQPREGYLAAYPSSDPEVYSLGFINPTDIETPYWHGTMGYTSNGLRWVGVDPDHPHLWYNLGCNGIGIVPAIAGAKKIAESFNKNKPNPSRKE